LGEEHWAYAAGGVLMHNIVSKSVFGPSFSRLDAEYVEKSAVEREVLVVSGYGGTGLAQLVQNATPAAEDVQAQTAAETYQENGAVRYIAIDSVDTEDGLSFEATYDSEADLPSRAKHLVGPGDILVSNVRPNRGAVALVRDDQAGAIASSGFTLVRLSSAAGLAPEYVFAVLKTQYAREQLVRRSRGSMYPAVLRDDVLELYIPKLADGVQTSVVALIKKAHEYQSNFFKEKRAAADLLSDFLQNLGSPPSPTETRRQGVDTTIVSSSELFGENGASRFDSEFFRGEYAEFDQRCAQVPNFILGDRYQLNSGRGLSPADGMSPYAKQAVLTNVGVNWSALDEEQGVLPKGAWRLAPNDILLACTAHEIPYVGRKVDVITELPEGIDDIGCVPDLMVIRPKESAGELSHHYVAAFLRSPAGLHQVQRCIRGLRGGHVYRDDLSRFVRVPLPPDDWMTSFDEIEVRAQKLRASSKKVTKDAIKMIADCLPV
jgi:hypothetical protein